MLPTHASQLRLCSREITVCVLIHMTCEMFFHLGGVLYYMDALRRLGCRRMNCNRTSLSSYTVFFFFLSNILARLESRRKILRQEGKRNQRIIVTQIGLFLWTLAFHTTLHSLSFPLSPPPPDLAVPPISCLTLNYTKALARGHQGSD